VATLLDALTLTSKAPFFLSTSNY